MKSKHPESAYERLELDQQMIEYNISPRGMYLDREDRFLRIEDTAESLQKN